MLKPDPIQTVWNRAVAALLPPPTLTVSEWADKYRVMDSTSPRPGPWRTSLTPFLREPMDCLSPSSPVQRVVLMKSAQVGGTEILLNFTGFIMHHSPAPTMLIQPSVEMAKRFSKQRLNSLIEASSELRKLVRNPRSRDSGNTVLLKEFPRGVLILTGANSAVGLRSLPAQNVLADEVDGWLPDADGEGDPFMLAVRRTQAFGSKRKILAVSTPTIEGASRIEALYKQSDQRKFFVPCPRCEHFQVLVWAGVVWEPGKPETAHYRCEACEGLIENHEKDGMLAHGEWRSLACGDGKTAGFHICALYAPLGWPSWAELATDFLEANKSKETLQTFVNTILGETWRDEAAVPVEADTLYQRREPFAAEVPAGGAVLTVGADVQDDRIELEIVAWGKDEESWSVAYHVLMGDPSQPDLWAELDGLLLRQYRHESGLELPISAVSIDSGYHTAAVYEFAWPRLRRKVYATKGVSGFGKPVWPRKASKGIGDAPVFMVGVDTAKERVYAKLKAEKPGPGYCHFPITRQRDWFDMLTSERIATRYRKGFAERFWYKPASVRNEALDCRAYAMAALNSLLMAGLRLNQHAEQLTLMAAGNAVRDSGYQVARSRFVGG